MRRTLLPLAVAALVVASCGGTSTSSVSTAQSATPATSAAEIDTAVPAGSGPVASEAGADTTAPPAASAPDALQFAAPLVGGGTIDFTQFAGRTVALWFWAPT